MLKEGRDRLKSIALMHEKLCGSKALARIDFATYIRNLSTRLFEVFEADPDQVKLRINVDPVFLDVKTATACGLITSELVSNSLKYAFPGERKGQVTIDFHREDDKKFILVIQDNGIGLPENVDFRSAKSLGFEIVNDLVSKLNGQIKLIKKGGTKFKITFKEADS